MATVYASFDAPAVANVQTGVLTGYDAATTYIVTINGKTVSIVGTGGTVTTTATALLALLQASTEPEYTEVAWTSNAGSIIATDSQDPAVGRTHTITLTKSGGTGTVTDFAQTTAASGPSGLIANNCRDSATLARGLPVSTDTFEISQSDVDLLYKLDAIAAVALAVLRVRASYTGNAGMYVTNADGTLEYNEYRPRFLQVDGATNCYIGEGEGDGSGRLMIDLLTTASNVFVYKTGTPADDHLHALILKGDDSANTLKVEGDSTVDVSPFLCEAATWGTVTAIEDSTLRLGENTTVTTINAGGNAVVTVNCNVGTPTINIYDKAVVRLVGSAAPGTVNVFGEGAQFIHQGSGTVTALNLYDGAVLDASENPNAFTVTTLNGYGAPEIKDPNSRMTITNAIGVNGSVFSDWKWTLKQGRALTLGAP